MLLQHHVKMGWFAALRINNDAKNRDNQSRFDNTCSQHLFRARSDSRVMVSGAQHMVSRHQCSTRRYGLAVMHQTGVNYFRESKTPSEYPWYINDKLSRPNAHPTRRGSVFLAVTFQRMTPVHSTHEVRDLPNQKQCAPPIKKKAATW